MAYIEKFGESEQKLYKTYLEYAEDDVRDLELITDVLSDTHGLGEFTAHRINDKLFVIKETLQMACNVYDILVKMIKDKKKE